MKALEKRICGVLNEWKYNPEHASKIIASEVVTDTIIAFSKWRDQNYEGMDDLWYCSTSGAGPFSNKDVSQDFLSNYYK